MRTGAGLTTDEVARGFMVDVAAMYQRLVRAKRKIRLAGIPFGVPERERLSERLDAVMQVIYLVFSEDYASARDDEFIRHELCGEAISLGRMLSILVPDEPEVLGLLALMLLHDARAPGRLDPDGVLVTPEHQDRSSSRHGQIEEGVALIDRALVLRRRGRYQIEAAIAALHSGAPTAEVTDWAQIDALVAAGELNRFHLVHSTRGELLARSGRTAEAIVAITTAAALAPSEAERRFLERRLGQLA